MKVSQNTKNKILKILISSELRSDSMDSEHNEHLNRNYKIKDFSSLKKRCHFISEDVLFSYLRIMEWENLINIDTDVAEEECSIYLLPTAFARYAAIKSENMHKYITLVFAILSTICAIIQVIDLFLQV